MVTRKSKWLSRYKKNKNKNKNYQQFLIFLYSVYSRITKINNRDEHKNIQFKLKQFYYKFEILIEKN